MTLLDDQPVPTSAPAHGLGPAPTEPLPDMLLPPSSLVPPELPLGPPSGAPSGPGWRARLLSESKLRLFWTLADQAVVSVGNFLTSNMLARHLPQEQYGAFGTLFETLLFLNGLQAA